MKFSLVFCTLGRDFEVDLFFDSLCNQSYNDYEIIIIDQNKDDRVYDLYVKYSNKFNSCKYIKSEKKGLSVSRNLGLKYVTGDVIAFPDDDCIYRVDTLENVYNLFFQRPEIDIISGSSTSNLDDLKLNTHFDIKSEVGINYLNAFGNAISYTLFFRNNTDDIKLVSFDELLGVGSKYGSTEETAYLFDMLSLGRVAIRNPTLIIYHPDKELDYSDLVRIKNYSLGVGAFSYKYFSISMLLNLKLLLGPLFRLFLSIATFNKPKVVWDFYTFKYRLLGYFGYKKDSGF
ncbi:MULTISPECIES: glycosyltransferase family A protein [Gammaproteobacteria]|uniref:glycosyltransferase family A protein n=1 Tax=Gammaproteobacteria TaxID=1236 RepID=UPI0004D959ED|nr:MULTISPECIES: glycosyltransferase family 2 protein [Gammaproteobacteria]KDX89676.1 glycosyl transferase 2 family protein [Escherichia coli 2-316-03_S3_C1]